MEVICKLLFYLSLTNICQRPRPTARLDTDKWEIDRNDIDLGVRVGGGNFGDVFKGTWRDQVVVAIKTLKDDQGAEEFNKEADVLKTLHHPNLVQVLQMWMNYIPHVGLFFLNNSGVWSCHQSGGSNDDDHGVLRKRRFEILCSGKWKTHVRGSTYFHL